MLYIKEKNLNTFSDQFYGRDKIIHNFTLTK